MKTGIELSQGVNKPAGKLQPMFIVHLFFFYLLWSLVRLFWLKPGIETWPAPFIDGIVKIVIWILPVFIFLHYVDRVDPISFLKVNKKPRAFLMTTLFVVIAAAILYVNDHLIGSMQFHISTSFNQWLNAVLLAGLIEETFFRGFVLQKISSWIKFYQANLITAVLFLFAHFPIWFAGGMPLESFFLNSIITLLLGIVTGFLFKRSGSLWTPILYHTIFNLLVALGF